jgi:hypothetical protein
MMAGQRRNSIGEELRALLPRSPDAYPQKIDLIRGQVLVIRMDDQAYRSASFLDDRIITPATQGAWFPGERISEAARQVATPRPLQFIFHTGHVGSTLVSRLLDETGSVLSLREPLPLRSMAEAQDVLSQPESLLSESQFGSLLTSIMGLWARGYDRTRTVVVKATSSAGRMAVRLLEARPESQAIYLNLRAESYLATLLAGANSTDDLRGHGPERMRRLRRRCQVPLAPLHGLAPGELAALGWLAETMSQRDALQRFPGRVLAVDFEELLADIRGGMGRIAGHLGISADDGRLDGIAASPVLTRYSKSPDLPFTPDLRRAILSDARRDHRDEIGRGMAWLEALARSEESVAAVLGATAGA